MTAARVRALMAARWTPTVEDDFPSPDQRDPVARDQLGRERWIPFPAAKLEEHFERVAVGATGFVRGDTVQDSFDQLPDAVLPQIARMGHRDQGRRVH
jgi:hypothetical protein